MSSRLQRPGWGPLNSTLFSWMGCIIAVNDDVVRAKRVERGRKIPGCRRKRRGNRRGKIRRRARLVTSRSELPSTSPIVSTIRMTSVDLAKQRYDRYVMGRAQAIVALRTLRSKLPHGNARRKRINSDLHLAKDRLARTMVRSEGPLEVFRPFAVIRLRVLLQIVSDGWDSICQRYYNGFESHGWEAGVGAIQAPGDYRAVPPPDSLLPEGIKKRSRVPKGPLPICRMCGCRGHRSTACEAPLARGLWPTLAIPAPPSGPSTSSSKRETPRPRKGRVPKKSGRGSR